MTTERIEFHIDDNELTEFEIEQLKKYISQTVSGTKISEFLHVINAILVGDSIDFNSKTQLN